jgi:sarcosine oxidase subunit beta
MTEQQPRWTREEVVDDALVADCRARLAHRYPSAADAPVVRAWAGLYDMTPDAHPLIGWAGNDVYVACGFSGHGFMQSPAVGSAVAHELLGLEPAVELAPYRLERFADGAVFPEQAVL